MTDENKMIAVEEESNEITVLHALEDMVKNNIVKIDELQFSLKEDKQMLEDVFINDSTYQDHAKAAKESAKIKTKTRAEIMKQPAVFQISQRIKSKQQDLKERRESLSDYLLELERMTGDVQLELLDGSVYEIKKTAKLVRRGK